MKFYSLAHNESSNPLPPIHWTQTPIDPLPQPHVNLISKRGKGGGGQWASKVILLFSFIAEESEVKNHRWKEVSLGCSNSRLILRLKTSVPPGCLPGNGDPFHPQPFQAQTVFKLLLNSKLGVPVMAQGKQIWLVSMRAPVLTLALLSGLRIQRCHALWCRSQMRLGSGVAMA